MTSQAGILNISLEGTMLLSGIFWLLGSYLFQSALMGIVCAILVTGLLMSVLFSIFVIKLKADEFNHWHRAEYFCRRADGGW